ncbi:MAG: GyrI-like domain-containing protein [Anaerolineae bacterium]|jgi:predicted transcriptional regulator YdeE|nr:GyrI-like domain-containing protein [Anaerolineae bacterium]
MQPFITKKPEMHLVGMSFYGDPFSTHGGWDGENEIGRVWARFMKYMGEKESELRTIIYPDALYEVHIYNEETIQKGIFEIFVGARLESIKNIPIELLIKTLPASEYARFTFEGDDISSDWYLSIDKWIAEAGYQRAHSFSFQFYDERFKGMDRISESILDVYMPVKLAE